MKALLVLATVALPISAQVTIPSGTAPATTATPPAGSVAGAGTVPAAGAQTIAGPFGSGTVNLAPGLTPINAAGASTLPAPSRRLDPRIGFPPPASGPVTPLVTNTGIGGFGGESLSVPEASTFPNGTPPFIGNTVGEDFVAPATNFPPTRALSVDLPPGSQPQRNAFGLPNPVALPPLAPTTPMNTVGAPSGSEIGRIGPVGAPAAVAPPTAPPPRPLPPRNPGARLPAIRH
jgi:hypothetical protein